MQHQPLHDLNWKVGHETLLPLNRFGIGSSLRSSSLSRIEGRLREALDQQVRAPDLVGFVDEMDELTPLNPLRNTPAHGSIIYPRASAVERTLTESTLYEAGRIRQDLSPSPSDSGFSDTDAPRPVTASLHHTTAPGMDVRQRHVMNADQHNRALSFSSTAPDEYPITGSTSGGFRNRPPTSPQLADQANDITAIRTAESRTRFVEEAVADARRELVTVRQREQTSRPLKIVNQDPERMPDPALRALFQRSADDELQIRRLNARDWLRVATWWLLKVLCHVSS